jgi:hypothetical protein
MSASFSAICRKVARVSFDERVVIRAAASAVYAELSEPERQLGLQPLLIDVREVERSEQRPASRVYEATERISLFGVPGWRIRIRVRVELTQPDEIIEFRASGAPGIMVFSRFTLVPTHTGTAIHQRYRAEVPALLRPIVGRIARRAQVTLLANLKRRLEAAPT